MARKVRTGAVVLLVLSSVASEAWTQDADALIDRGVELRGAGRDEAALQVFRQAWEARRSPRALAQIALAEQALGRWVDAETHLAEALSDADDDWIHRRNRDLQSALAEIRQHVGRLEVQANVRGAQVLIGDSVVGTLPLGAMLHVQTGSVTFTVRAEGYRPVTRTITVQGRAPLREVVALERQSGGGPGEDARAGAAAVAPPGGPQVDAMMPGRAEAVHPRGETAATPTRRYVGFGLIGTGAASLAVATVFLVLNANLGSATADATPVDAEPYGAWARFQANENYDGQRSGAEVCALAQQRSGADAALVRDLCASTSSTATIALVAGIAGGALAATGLVLALTARPAPTRAARWGVVPWLALGVGGATLHAVW